MTIAVPERSQVAVLSVDFQCIAWTGVDRTRTLGKPVPSGEMDGSAHHCCL
jgi:hypothetical protein